MTLIVFRNDLASKQWRHVHMIEVVEKVVEKSVA